MQLVLCQHDIDGFRATRMRQCKTQFEGNGKPFPRTATPQWRIRVAPFGQDDKLSSALLHSFELVTTSPALVRLPSESLSSCCTRQYHADRVLYLEEKFPDWACGQEFYKTAKYRMSAELSNTRVNCLV